MVRDGMTVHMLAVSVSLQPYASCKNTRFQLSSARILHQDKIAVTIQPRDTDNLTISNTLVKYRVLLHYEDGLTLNRTYTMSGVDTNSLLLPSGSVAFSGQYSVTVKLEDGWDDEHYIPGRCRLNGTARFNVSCEYGYEPNAATKRCSQMDFSNKCEASKVYMKGLPAGLVEVRRSKKETATIGALDHLSVTLASHRASKGLTIRQVPLKAVLEASIDDGLTVEKTGEFKVELVDESSAQSCTLLSKLTVQCGTGFEEDKNNHCAHGTAPFRSLFSQAGVAITI